MRFNFNNYDETYAMHCDSEGKARVFLKHLHTIGKRWSSGRRYDETFVWKGEHTCYRFVAGTHDVERYYMSDKSEQDLGFKVKIIEFDDFDWEDSIVDRQCNMSFDDWDNLRFDDIMGFGQSKNS